MKVSLRSTSMVTALAMTAVLCAAQNQVPAQAPNQGPAQGQDRVIFPQGLDQSQAANPADASKPQQVQVVGAVHGSSNVRIVRISQVTGQVRLDRGTDQKFELAFLNLPILAGEQLQTLDGLVEVEFENNSSLRLTPNSLVEFAVLQRDPSGATNTTVKLLKGSIYVSLADSKGADGFNVVAGNQTIALTPSSHLRLDLAGSSAKLVVLKGNVTVADASGSTVVGKKKAVSFDTAASAPPVMAHVDGAAMFDKWDKNAVDYHQQRSAAMGFAQSPYAYGVQDLGYYGSYSNLGSCGAMWRPYLASASWNPYGSGVWGWYPGSGYSFVSPYPWGWTPYHTGSWEFCPSSGSWGWRPDGSWSGLNTLRAGSTRDPRRPLPIVPAPPKKGESTLVAYNIKSMPVSRVGSESNFVLTHGSAGMGVPRGVFNNLGKISETAAQRGSVTMSLSSSQAERGLIATNRSSAGSSMNGMNGGAAGARASNAGSASHASFSSSPSSSGMSASHASSAASSGTSGGGGGSHH